MLDIVIYDKGNMSSSCLIQGLKLLMKMRLEVNLEVSLEISLEVNLDSSCTSRKCRTVSHGFIGNFYSITT